MKAPLVHRLKEILLTDGGERELLSARIESFVLGVDIDTIQAERQREQETAKFLIRSIQSQKNAAREELHAMVSSHMPAGHTADDVKYYTTLIDTCDDTIAFLKRSV